MTQWRKKQFTYNDSVAKEAIYKLSTKSRYISTFCQVYKQDRKIVSLFLYFFREYKNMGIVNNTQGPEMVNKQTNKQTNKQSSWLDE